MNAIIGWTIIVIIFLLAFLAAASEIGYTKTVIVIIFSCVATALLVLAAVLIV